MSATGGCTHIKLPNMSLIRATASTRDPPTGGSGPYYHQIALLSLFPLHVTFHGHLLKVKFFLPPSLLEILQLSPTVFQSRILWEFLFLVLDSQAAEADVRLGALTFMGEPLQYNCSPVPGSPTWIYGV